MVLEIEIVSLEPMFTVSGTENIYGTENILFMVLKIETVSLRPMIPDYNKKH